jgi:molecular chaperone GrpE
MSEEKQEGRPERNGGDGSSLPDQPEVKPDADLESNPTVRGAQQPSPLGDALVQAQARIVELERRVAEQESEVAKEREAATDYMSRWQRAQADFSNLRRRAQQEQEQMQRLAGAHALAGILPALDSFERAFATLPPTLRHLSWIDGIGLVHLQLHGALQAAGIKPFAPDRGAAFDARREQSIGEIETSEVPPGTVAAVIQPGYELGDLVLRPALVQLARAPQTSQTSPGESQAPAPEPEQQGSGP